MKICPECQNKNNHLNRFCEYCGSNFSQKDKEKTVISNIIGDSRDIIKENVKNITETSVSSNVVKKDINYAIRNTEVKSCPDCNNKNNIDAEFCGMCGKDLPLVTEMQIIECPDCGYEVRDDVNFCRFCGHNFKSIKTSKESIKNFGRFFKANKDLISHDVIFCQNCGESMRFNQSGHCINCVTQIPSSFKYGTTELKHEVCQKLLVNDFFVPLSNEYKINFRKTTLSEYFDITYDQESHIIYLIIKKLIEDDKSTDIVDYFKKCLDETINRTDIKQDILDLIEPVINDVFNSEGFDITFSSALKDSYYETIETPVIEDKHSGLTKGVATLGFGLVGLAATSGVKQTTSTQKVLKKGEYIHANININSENIILKSYVDKYKVASFAGNSNKVKKSVFKWEDIDHVDDEFYFVFNSGETLKFNAPDYDKWIKPAVMDILGTPYASKNRVLFNRCSGKLKNDIDDLFLNILREKIRENKKINNHQNKLNNKVEELEKIMEMYEKGLLTDDEFSTMKQSIIGNSQDNSKEYCNVCGTEILEGSVFCTECGTKIEK